MRVYTKVIPGKEHILPEDHLFERTFPDSLGNSYGVFIIGDGLSGSAGDKANTASNYAVNSLGKYLQETLSPGAEEGKILELIATKMGDIHRRLLDKGETTLDSVVVRNEQQCYIHHVGDSRVYFVHADGRVEEVTRVEDIPGSGDAGPSNSLGGRGQIIEGKNKFERNLQGVKYIFLTTDGLESRATDEQVQTLLRTLTSYNAPFLLDNLAQIIERPREKLNKFQNKFLHEILKGKAQPSREESEDNGKLVELIFSFYGKDKEVTERVDAKLKHDDTTMILVDLEDKLAHSQVLVEERERFSIEREGLLRRIQAAEREPEQLLNRLDRLAGELETEKSARRTLDDTYDRAKREAKESYDELKGEKEGLGRKLREKETDTGRLQEELRMERDKVVGANTAKERAIEDKSRAEQEYQRKEAGWNTTKITLEEEARKAKAAKEKAESEHATLNIKYETEKGGWGGKETSLQQQLDNAQNEKRGVQKNYEELRAAHNLYVGAAWREIEGLTNQVNEHQRQKEENTAALAREKEEKERLRQEKEQLQRRHDALLVAVGGAKLVAIIEQEDQRLEQTAGEYRAMIGSPNPNSIPTSQN